MPSRILQGSACLLLAALVCFGQIPRADRFAANATEIIGVAHGTAKYTKDLAWITAQLG